MCILKRSRNNLPDDDVDYLALCTRQRWTRQPPWVRTLSGAPRGSLGKGKTRQNPQLQGWDQPPPHIHSGCFGDKKSIYTNISNEYAVRLVVYLQLLDRLGSVQLPPREGVPQHVLRAGGVDGGVVADGSSIINLNDTRSTDCKMDSFSNNQY